MEHVIMKKLENTFTEKTGGEGITIIRDVEEEEEAEEGRVQSVADA